MPKAVKSLLAALGVALTDKAKSELDAVAGGDRSIEAQKLVAQSEKAQAAGSNIEAMRLFC